MSSFLDDIDSLKFEVSRFNDFQSFYDSIYF